MFHRFKKPNYFQLLLGFKDANIFQFFINQNVTIVLGFLLSTDPQPAKKGGIRSHEKSNVDFSCQAFGEPKCIII